MSRRAWMIGAGLVLAALVVGLVWTAVFGWGTEPERAAPGADDAEDARQDEVARVDPWIPLDEEIAPEPRRERGGWARRQRWGGGRPERGSAEWEEWRARREERWRRSVDIVALGPSPPGFDADAVREALRPGREALRECIDQGGGFRAMRDAVRSSAGDAGRPRRRASFEVRSDGSVEPASLALDPAMPAPFGQCFEAFFTSARFENAGDGARVELPLGRGGRGGRGGDGDRGRE